MGFSAVGTQNEEGPRRANSMRALSNLSSTGRQVASQGGSVVAERNMGDRASGWLKTRPESSEPRHGGVASPPLLEPVRPL